MRKRGRGKREIDRQSERLTRLHFHSRSHARIGREREKKERENIQSSSSLSSFFINVLPVPLTRSSLSLSLSRLDSVGVHLLSSLSDESIVPSTPISRIEKRRRKRGDVYFDVEGGRRRVQGDNKNKKRTE